MAKAGGVSERGFDGWRCRAAIDPAKFALVVLGLREEVEEVIIAENEALDRRLRTLARIAHYSESPSVYVASEGFARRVGVI